MNAIVVAPTMITAEDIADKFCESAHAEIAAGEARNTAEITAQESCKIVFEGLQAKISAGSIKIANLAKIADDPTLDLDSPQVKITVPLNVPDICQYGRIGRILSLEGTLDAPVSKIKTWLDNVQRAYGAARVDRMIKLSTSVDEAVSEIRKADGKIKADAAAERKAKKDEAARKAVDAEAILQQALALVEQALDLDWSDGAFTVADKIVEAVNAKIDAEEAAEGQRAA